MIKFEKVSRFADVDIQLPERKTTDSAGYDFVVAEDIIVPSIGRHFNGLLAYADPIDVKTLEEVEKLTKEVAARPTLVPTGIKCHLELANTSNCRCGLPVLLNTGLFLPMGLV